MDFEDQVTVEDEAPGTRFLLFPQPPFLDEFQIPELVEVSSPPGSVGPGPSNDRMYTVDPIGKTAPYGIEAEGKGQNEAALPPWNGPVKPLAQPDENGHFDHIAPSDPAFEQAHLFGSAHFTMDVWEGYFGRPIPWHFRRDYDCLELTLLPSMDNALIGWGFLETGGTREYGNEYRPYSLNFDVVAHEIGHAIIYNEVGIPAPDKISGEYYGFHESAADVVALLTSLHFGSVVDDVLENTHGNLYTINKLSRFAELSGNKQIRLAANDAVLSDFEQGWTDEHDLAQPLTGAMFDILIDVFHEHLLSRGLISQEMEDLSDQLEGRPEYGDVMQGMFDQKYAENPEGFRLALLEARDYLGTYLADTWSILDPDYLSYYGVGQALEKVDQTITGGRFYRIINGNFNMREIGHVVTGYSSRLLNIEKMGKSALRAKLRMCPDRQNFRPRNASEILTQCLLRIDKLFPNTKCSYKTSIIDTATGKPMTNTTSYEPPKVWKWESENGGAFAKINRPIAGSTHDKELSVGKHPLQLYSLATPNGVKVTVMLEELLAAGHTEAEYDAWLINIGEGDQFGSGFVDANPNSKIPALVDHSTKTPTRVFESGSILLYLAEKFGAFMPQDPAGRTECLNWLFWQMGSAPYLGGGFGHFYKYAPVKIEYCIDRFTMEAKRQLDVLDRQLADNQFICGSEYTIADMAIWPWYGAVVTGAVYDAAEFIDGASYKNILSWADEIGERDTVKRGRMVNRAFGELSEQLRERHDASDFDKRTQDKLESQS